MTKLRFQRKVKHLMKGKVEAYKSYFLLNLQKIFLYEMKRPKPVFRTSYLSEWYIIMSGTTLWYSPTPTWLKSTMK